MPANAADYTTEHSHFQTAILGNINVSMYNGPELLSAAYPWLPAFTDSCIEFKIDAIRYRSNPIIMGNLPAIPPNDDTYYRGLLRSATVWEELEREFQGSRQSEPMKREGAECF